MLAGAIAVTFYASAPAQAPLNPNDIKDHRTEPELFFLQEGDCPNSLTILPGPPDGGSILFLYDQARYNWGKLQRKTARGEQAAQDARVTGDGLPKPIPSRSEWK